MPTAHFPYCATPKVLLTPWALPTPAFATLSRGAGKNLLHPYHRALSPPTCSCRYAVASQALTGFQLRPLRLVLLPPRRWRGSRATKSCILPLTPWNRPNTHRRGRWIGLPPAPAASQVRVGFGASPKGLFFVFEVVRVDVTVQKGQKMCIFRIFATKNTANLANF